MPDQSTVFQRNERHFQVSIGPQFFDTICFSSIAKGHWIKCCFCQRIDILVIIGRFGSDLHKFPIAWRLHFAKIRVRFDPLRSPAESRHYPSSLILSLSKDIGGFTLYDG